jgi:hypothetical protein
MKTVLLLEVCYIENFQILKFPYGGFGYNLLIEGRLRESEK